MDASTILDRVYSLANEAMFTIALQCRRLRSIEPEDETFIFRWWADLQFLILALCRLHRAVRIACKVPQVAKDMKAALYKFDLALPHLTKLRNVGEHVGEYAVDCDSRHDKNVNRKDLQVGSWDGTVYKWLDTQLNVHDALTASEELYRAFQTARKGYDTLYSWPHSGSSCRL